MDGFVEASPDDEEEILREQELAEREAAEWERLEAEDDYPEPAPVASPQPPKKRGREESPAAAARKVPNVAEPPEKGCVTCGTALSIFASKSQANPGRKFYKCQTCGAFEWCDAVDASPPPAAGDRETEPPLKECPCGYGPLAVRTSNTAANPNRKFYKCVSCDLFEWCPTAATPPAPSVPSSPAAPSVPSPPPAASRTMPCGKCGATLTIRTSQSQRNPGRQFFSHPDCDFFEWADEARPSTSPRPTTSPRRPPNDATTANTNTFKCPKCDATLTARTSNSAANPGRKFFKCNPCDTFNWADRLPAASSASPRRPPPATNSNQRTNTTASNARPCYRCGQVGHWANACPQRAAMA
mmetsp:Transcript_8014/g.26344  ORF Transcript_8014/g.26344 Transcript_8014/m.26344 type:complete len:356 (+) Transcript_8014:126-1193(+)|eukprot:CAMPEP_0118901506 /NCGR_PEP_ID=MMETSP1166-20130328/7181_1 /TAXON_ID=1104430 /ORGANISM="Chrysoreinhardia sp, Strain CCMP3193" /LENGTH=355 /DNA_ID=CAMNT_0006840683 /DNA_START=93 /DNA_END=1160 /DNA_ORIENTATION=+